MERAAKRQKKREENEKTKKGTFRSVRKTLKKRMLNFDDSSDSNVDGVFADSETATISSMQKCGRLWKWPEKVDQLGYEWEYVLFHIDEPLKMSQTRNVYTVPELEYLWN
ncbi:unnamed protein product [Pieris macdunnoughi]|uniref:Uncharacterized protein n=1 Tax=Pieris macdunnoughi TaxID=345717 RepID=A0A821QN21_9NEOP|nr:unnamed protein product [Pieris macdunnoughi]